MNVIEWSPELRFLIAVALGFLVGLERESTKLEHKYLFLGGVRTYPIVSMYGFGCAWLFRIGATVVLPVGLLSVGALTVVAYMAKIKAGRFGSTSEITLLLTFVMGGLALLVDVWVAMALGVISTMLLSEKAELESYVENLDRVGFLATIRFLLVTVIVLPILPNHEYTQFQLNPTRVWQIVIMVSTIGYVGYFLSRKFGDRVGLWLSGLLGGIVSSTAVSISAGRLAQQHPARAASALQASILASGMMYLRILVLIWVLNPAFLGLLLWKLILLACIGAALSFRLPTVQHTTESSDTPNLQNPFEIRPAVVFAVLFVLLTIATSLVRTSFGDAGTLALSAVTGVADTDPYILSIIHGTALDIRIGAMAILIAVMSNTVAKGCYFGALVPSMRKETAWRYSLWALLHVPLLFL